MAERDSLHARNHSRHLLPHSFRNETPVEIPSFCYAAGRHDMHDNRVCVDVAGTQVQCFIDTSFDLCVVLHIAPNKGASK